MQEYSLFDHSTAPSLTGSDDNDNNDGLSLGTVFKSATKGYVKSVWLYIGNTNLGGINSTAYIFSYTDPETTVGTALASKNFILNGSVGWQEIVFDAPMAITKNTRYVASYYLPSPDSHYVHTNDFFVHDFSVGALTAESGTAVGNGRFNYSSSEVYPGSASPARAWYGVDVTVQAPPSNLYWNGSNWESTANYYWNGTAWN